MLSERQRLVLVAIVEEYVKTNEPVGSLALCKRPELNFSSATLRNEMAHLEEMGYLEKTHTSSGRIPSEKGYRLYVNEIMRRGKKDESLFPMIDEIFEKCDIITIHVPLDESTRAMIDKKAINKMKDGVAFINFARDALVVDTDMKEALESGKVSKYITDFPNPVTVKMPNTIVIPHLGGSTLESENNCAIAAVREVMDYLENGNITNSVNYPSVDAGVCQSVQRITINHYNVSGMISKFTNVLRKYSCKFVNEMLLIEVRGI